MGLLELHELEELDKQVEQAKQDKKILIVDCFASWCGPCKKLTPLLEQASEKHENVTVVKVDVGESDDFADLYEIVSIPTLKYYYDGKLVDTTTCLMDMDEIDEQLSKLFDKYCTENVTVTCEEVVVE